MSLPKTLQNLINNSGYGTNLTGNDNDIVHKTGNEVIDGLKVFHTNEPDHIGRNKVSRIAIKNDNLIQGTTTPHTIWSQVVFSDGSNNSYESTGSNITNRIGTLETITTSSDANSMSMIAYKYTTDVEYQAGEAGSAGLTVGFDGNQVKYATAPSTSENRSEACDILTRDWIPKDIRIVHTTGNEDIEGLKYFKSGMKVTNGLDINASNTCLTYIQLTGSSPSYADFRFGVGDQRNSSTNPYSFAVIRAWPTIGFQIGTRYGSENSWLEGPNLSLEAHSGNFKLTAKAGSSGTARYLVGYTNGTLSWDGQAVQTSSDKRVKTSLTFVPDGVLDSWGKVEWGQFQYLDAIKEKGPSARLHVGLIAQQVLAAFNENGFDACDYGILCHEVHSASPEVIDENGEVITPAKDAIDLWMARYTEALCMEAAYQRRRADRAEARIATLEEEVSSLKSQFSQLLNSAAG